MLRSAIAACNVCGRPLLRQSPVPCRTALVSQPASGGRSVRTQARRNMAKELLELQKERTEAPAKQPAVPTGLLTCYSVCRTRSRPLNNSDGAVV